MPSAENERQEALLVQEVGRTQESTREGAPPCVLGTGCVSVAAGLYDASDAAESICGGRDASVHASVPASPRWGAAAREGGASPPAGRGAGLSLLHDHNSPTAGHTGNLGAENPQVSGWRGLIATRYRYPDGGEEVIMLPSWVYGARAPREPQDEPSAEPKCDPEVTARQKARRAATEVRRTVRMMGRVSHWTTSFGSSGERDFGIAVEHVTEWLHRSGWHKRLAPYVFILEWHPGGHGWHVHLATPRRLARGLLVALQRSWSAYLTASGYQIRTRSGLVWHKVTRHENGRRAGRYLGKELGGYMVKAFDEGAVPAGRRRYHRSVGAGALLDTGREWVSASIADVRDSLGSEEGWFCAVYDDGFVPVLVACREPESKGQGP